MLKRFIKSYKDILFNKVLITTLTFLCLIFLALLIILFNLRGAIHEKNNSNTNDLVIEKSYALDQNLNSIISMCSSIAQKPDVLYFSINDEQNDIEKYLTAKDLGDTFVNLSLANNIVKNYIVYIADHKVVIGPFFTTFRIEEYFSTLPQSNDMSYEQWLKSDFTESSLMMFYTNMLTENQYQQLTIRTPLLYIGSNERSGFLEIDLDISNLVDSTQIAGAYKSLILLTKNGELIYNSGKNEDYIDYLATHEKRDGTFHTVDSTIVPMQYVFVFEDDPVVDFIDILLTAIFGIVVLLFALLIFVTVISSSFVNKYITEISTLLENTDNNYENNSKNNINFIKSSIVSLASSYTNLRLDYTTQLTLLRDNLITQIVHSSMSSDREIIQFIRSLNLNYIIADHYLMICGNMPYSANITSVKPLEDTFKTVFNEYDYNMYVQSLVNNRFCIMISSANTFNEKDIEQPLLEITKLIEENHNIKLHYVVDQVFTSLIYAPASYYTGLNILDVAIFNESSTIIYTRDKSSTTNICYIPIETESHIIALIQLNKYASAEKLLDELVSVNINSEQDLAGFSYEIRSMLIKLVFTVIVSDIDRAVYFEQINTIFLENTFENILTSTKKLLFDICEGMQKNRDETKGGKGEEIYNFILNNYLDSSFCLATIADEFNISEKHAYRLFKKHTNSTISAFIEELRMNKAIEYLLSGDMSISNIPGAVGFMSENTFYKAFKRKFMMSPSEYRSRYNTSQDK